MLAEAYPIIKDNFNNLIRKNCSKKMHISYRDLLQKLQYDIRCKEPIIIEMLEEEFCERGCFLSLDRVVNYATAYYAPLYCFLKYKNDYLVITAHPSSPYVLDASTDTFSTTYTVVLSYVAKLGDLYSSIPMAIATNYNQLKSLLEFTEELTAEGIVPVQTRTHFVQTMPKLSDYQLSILTRTARFTPWPTLYV